MKRQSFVALYNEQVVCPVSLMFWFFCFCKPQLSIFLQFFRLDLNKRLLTSSIFFCSSLRYKSSLNNYCLCLTYNLRRFDLIVSTKKEKRKNQWNNTSYFNLHTFTITLAHLQQSPNRPFRHSSSSASTITLSTVSKKNDPPRKKLTRVTQYLLICRLTFMNVVLVVVNPLLHLGKSLHQNDMLVILSQRAAEADAGGLSKSVSLLTFLRQMNKTSRTTRCVQDAVNSGSRLINNCSSMTVAWCIVIIACGGVAVCAGLQGAGDRGGCLDRCWCRVRRCVGWLVDSASRGDGCRARRYVACCCGFPTTQVSVKLL
eukprot:m.234051 g.234051  ORF g.234051 m.234051 type:complete len:315 (-) comp17084_c0_seq5:1170-2114(-)